MKIKTLAIPIRKVDFSDSSQIVTFFTRGHGIVEGIAKGAFREKNPFQGPFDLATLCEIVFLKPAASSQALRIITEATQMHGFRGIRHRWDRHLAASFVLELLRAAGSPDDPVPDLFDTAHAALSGLETAAGKERISDLLAAFELKMLRGLGLCAELTACSACGRPWKGGSPQVYFCLDGAGLLCSRCRAGGSAHSGRLVPAGVVDYFNALGGAEPGDSTVLLPAAPESVEPEVRRWGREVLSQQRLFLLEKEFRMIRYVS